MEYSNFISSLNEPEPPENLNQLLQVLWYDAQGDWESAHKIAQVIQTKEGSHLHAYLHRKEGDQTNARFWYKQAQKKSFEGTIETEWETLVKEYID